MSTVRQKILAKKIVENMKLKKPKTKKEILVSSGFALNSASQNPDRIMESLGVSQELRALGFHEDAAKAVVEKIMNSELVAPADRLKATDQVFKVRGTYAPEKQAIVHAFVIADEDKKRIDNILEDNE